MQAEKQRRKMQEDAQNGVDQTRSPNSNTAVDQTSYENSVSAGSGSKADPGVPPDDDGMCRLVPRLIDLRHPVESNREGIKGAIVVSPTQKLAAERFSQWAGEREDELGKHHLTPMHVLMTSCGVLSPEQETFLRSILAAHIPNVCILSGGYPSLVPYF